MPPTLRLRLRPANPEVEFDSDSDSETNQTLDYGAEFGFNGSAPVSRANIKLLKRQIVRRVNRLRKRAEDDKLLKEELMAWNRIVRQHERNAAN